MLFSPSDISPHSKLQLLEREVTAKVQVLQSDLQAHLTAYATQDRALQAKVYLLENKLDGLGVQCEEGKALIWDRSRIWEREAKDLEIRLKDVMELQRHEVPRLPLIC